LLLDTRLCPSVVLAAAQFSTLSKQQHAVKKQVQLRRWYGFQGGSACVLIDPSTHSGQIMSIEDFETISRDLT
jgi:hypothetical protein